MENNGIIDAPATQGEVAGLEDLNAIIDRQRAFFATGKTRDISWRLGMLKRFKAYLHSHEAEILQALHDDLGKCDFEGYATELGLVYDEINACTKHGRSWARPQRVYTPIVHFHSSSKVYPEPFGVCAVMAPWNYPIQLALNPMVDALCAGNCVVLKPSRTSVATSAFLGKMCAEVFPPEYVFCLPGSVEMNEWILQVRFDKIFFTGSPKVGHRIMHAAADNLTHVTMELGGKSPCIVDESANVKRAAQRIAWGKCINSGQTCVAPDYFLVHERIVDDFLAQLEFQLHKYYGANILESDEYPHMINRHHFDRVCGLIDNRNPDARVAFGGERNSTTLKIAPTAITGVTLEDPVMGEEIFGPVLPILTYRTLDEALAIIAHFEHPLACYLFSDDRQVQRRVVAEVPFGGGDINDVIVHLANNHMGFGGVGNSGLGAYHGKKGFECFSHFKSMLKKGTWLEIPVRVPPFGNKIKLLRMLMH